MSRIFFMTVHGTLVTRGAGGDGALDHRELRSIPNLASLLCVDADIAAFRQGFGDFVLGAEPPPVTVEADALGPIAVHVDAARGLVALERNGTFLSAGSTGGNVSWAATEPLAWERLLPISDNELGALVTLLSNEWIIRSSRQVIHPWQVALGPDHTLRLGELLVPLARNLPLVAADFPFRFNLLAEGWRIEEILLFKPMVFYAAYNSPAVHNQLMLSLQSLAEFGRYNGNVHVLTDLSVKRLREAVPALPAERLTVQPLEPRDFAGWVASKYCILEHAPAWKFQPLCFLDPDVVINANLRPMLVAMALADSVTAPLEDVGPLRSWPPVGGTLLQRDGREARFARGFNAGTLGIPNLRAHEATLRLIRRIIENLLKQEGRASLEWVDQEVANYVSFVQAKVDTASVSRFIRFGAPHDSETPGPLTGLIHFWATGKAGRDGLMRHYIEVLREHARAAHKLA